MDAHTVSSIRNKLPLIQMQNKSACYVPECNIGNIIYYPWFSVTRDGIWIGNRIDWTVRLVTTETAYSISIT
jgi:hypothetical protein